ncbi:MAG: BamA/TamA family outer membrane protein [Bacteroidales bacterium]
MKLFLTILLHLTILHSPDAQIILRIVHQPEKEIDGKIDSVYLNGSDYKSFNDSIDIEIYLQNLISELHSAAYLAASIDSLNYTDSLAFAYLYTGRQYRRVNVSVDNIDSETLRNLNIRTRRFEKPVSFEDFRRLQDRILSHFENTGYPFVKVFLSEPLVDGDMISGLLIIDKNNRFNIDNIHILGDLPVDVKHLYRHIGISVGDPYSEKKFTNAGVLLRETAFLTEVRAPEMEFMRNTADMYLYVGRRQASQFSGILGILPGGPDRSFKIAGELNLSLLNVLGKMENIELQWQNPGNNVQQLDVGAGQPYLFGRSFGVDLQLHMHRQDSTYMKIEAEAGIPFTLQDRGILRAWLRTTGSTLIAGGGYVAGLTVPAAEIRGQSAGLSWRRHKIDNRINPYRGWLVHGSAGAGNKSITLPADQTSPGKVSKGRFGEGSVRLEWFIPVTGSTTLMFANLSAIKMNFGTQDEDNFFFANEMYLLGGIHSIRGFDERSIAASAYSIQRIEYRYLFEESSNIFLFFDGMVYKQRLPGPDISDTPYGFGGGFTFNTRAGQFAISYALGSQMGNPLSFRSGKVHMGIVNRF